MRSDHHNDRQRRQSRRRDNLCPVHEVRLVTKYYGEKGLTDSGENLDLLIIQCPVDGCFAGHGMVENYQARKEEKRKKWLKKNARKIVSDELEKIENEETSTTNR